MIQKRILMAVAIPVLAAAARFISRSLRAKGHATAAGRIEQAIDLVSPKNSGSKRRRFGR